MGSNDPHEWWKSAPEGQASPHPAAWGTPPDAVTQRDVPASGPGYAQNPVLGAGFPPQPVSGAGFSQQPVSGPWEVPPLEHVTGSGPGGPNKSSGPLIAALVVVVVLALAGVIGLVALRSSGDDKATAASVSGSATTSQVTSTTAVPTTTAPGGSSSADPQLRDVAPVSVLGPVWQDSDDVYVMAFQGWPFAFRAGGSWGCMRGSIEAIPDAQAWSCIDEGNPAAKQRVNVMLRECPDGCDDAVRGRYDAEWLDEPERATVFDDRTVYVEDLSNQRGLYGVDLSRYVADRPGGELRWQVGVYAESPPRTKDTVLKIVNDIVGQTR